MLHVVSAWQFSPNRYVPAGVRETYAFAPCAKHFTTNTRTHLIHLFLKLKSDLCLIAPGLLAQTAAHLQDCCVKLGAWRNKGLVHGNRRSQSREPVKLPSDRPKATASIAARAYAETSFVFPYHAREFGISAIRTQDTPQADILPPLAIKGDLHGTFSKHQSVGQTHKKPPIPVVRLAQ